MEIPKAEQLLEQVFAISGPGSFLQTALQVFRFQYYGNPVYQAYCKLLKINPEKINSLEQIPFLPVSFFKTHAVAATVYDPEYIFESSGTTGTAHSRHLVKDLSVYRQSLRKTFMEHFGPPSGYCILGLLPSYLERGHSSLVYMVDDLVTLSGHPKSGFYLYDFEKLAQTLAQLERQEQPTLLIGVTYALLDFSEQFPMKLQHTLVMETGGMKGRRKEWLRVEVHDALKHSFSLPRIHSEYGMTELLSQAYAPEEGMFRAPPWMRVMVREEDDPFAFLPDGRSGALNVIDLANLFSCSFIATEDIGMRRHDGTFTVAGRQDSAALRGCSLLYV